MLTTNSTFRNGFYAGALLAVAAGVYLFQLWQPERQVSLHSIHLVEALEERDLDAVASFLNAGYQDQWGHDRASLLSRLGTVLRYARDLDVQANGAWVELNGNEAAWYAKITVQGGEGEVNAIIENHVNPVVEPFKLQWRRESWKPWDWTLVGVTNSEFQLPPGTPW